MKTRLITLALTLTLIAPVAWSHGDQPHPVEGIAAGRDIAKADISVPADAAAAVAAIERFSEALSAGHVDRAVVELDAAVIILESGGVERSRDEYLSDHAKSDADFLKTAHVTLKRRSAHVSGDLVWVTSESTIRALQGDEKLTIDSTETMIVKKNESRWKIVHIHWSSRRANVAH